MPGAGDPIDDEDEFLYGTSNQETSSAQGARQTEAPPSDSLALVDASHETQEPSVNAPDASDEEDEEESDESDIEFIIDPNAPLVPPSRSVSFAPSAPTPNAMATETPTTKELPSKPPADPTPLPIQEPPAKPAPVEARPRAPQAVHARALEEPLGPEGPPPPAPSTGPALQLDPSAESLQYPPTDSLYDGRTQEEQAQEPPPMTIYQVDIDSLPEKPWRRPGANLSDWFNYGFDEHTWALWCAKKNTMSEARAELGAESETAAPGMPFMPPMDGAQDAFAAMFGPGAMMNMPSMPAWPGMPDDGQATGMTMPPAMPGLPGAPWAEAPPSESEPRSPQDGQHEGHPSGSDPQESRHERRGRRGGRRHGGRSGGTARRSEDEEDYARSQAAYNDRDTAHGAGDTLDYGARPDDGRWHRGSPRRADYGADDEPYDPEQFGRPPPPHHAHRDRPSRRERERLRHERRSGRGGQKRGPPEGVEDGGDYASKRFHGHRGP